MSTASISAKTTSTNRRILNAAFAVLIATLAVKFVATVKEFTVAGIFGRSDALEAFLAAALIPGLLINLIAESMNQALVPTLVRVKLADGLERAQQLFSNTLSCACLLLVTASLGMGLTARFFFPLIGSHFAPGKLILAEHLFYGLLPVVVLTGIASLCISVMNTTGRFAVPALTPIATPFIVLAGVSLFAGRLGIWAMVYSHRGRRTSAGHLGGMDDEIRGVSAQAAMVRNGRSHGRGCAAVWARLSQRAGSIRRSSCRPGHGGDASCWKCRRAGVRSAVCRRTDGAAGRRHLFICDSILL